MIVLVIDPSGNYEEGKGTTGYAVFRVTGDEFVLTEKGSLCAKDYESRYLYWSSMARKFVGVINPDFVVIEDYRLYNTRAMGAQTQSFSLMETPRFIGYLEMRFIEERCIHPIFQMAKDTKPYEDDIMIKLGIFEKKGKLIYYNGVKTNDHERMAIKHFYCWFDRRKKK